MAETLIPARACPACHATRLLEPARHSWTCTACGHSWSTQPARERYYYAIAYPHGHAGHHDAQTPIAIYRFSSAAQRDQWVHAGPASHQANGRSAVQSDHAYVKAARRHADVGASWPRAVYEPRT